MKNLNETLKDIQSVVMMAETGSSSGTIRFHYLYSCDLDINIQIKIGSLEGKLERPTYEDLLNDPLLKHSGIYQDTCPELCIKTQIWSDNEPNTLAITTSYKSFTTRWNWNEWISLPIKYCDLPRNSQLCLTIYECCGPGKYIPVGGTTLPLFGKLGVYKQGLHDLRIWRNQVADGNLPSKTPAKVKDSGNEVMESLSKLTKRHHTGRIPQSDWLDRLTFREIELINEREKRTSNYLYLMVEFPRLEYHGVEYTVVYYEKGGDDMVTKLTQSEYSVLNDDEILLENLVEGKHHKLARSVRSGLTDRDLKPDAGTRDQLHAIVESPPTKTLASEEQDLVWRFRFYLSNQKKALTKFLKCVTWTSTSEVRQAVDLMNRWAPIDPEDALELLGPNFTYPTVRKYAVSRLSHAPDEDLQLYLLQLVQALKYEDFDEICAGLDPRSLMLSVRSFNSADSFPSPEKAGHDLSIDERFNTEMESPVLESSPLIPVETSQPTPMRFINSESGEYSVDLPTFLIQRACANSALVNYFYWYLMIECEDPEPNVKHDARVREMYLVVMKKFLQALAKGGKEWRRRRAILNRQQQFLDRLVSLMKAVARESGNRKKKMERLRTLLADRDFFKGGTFLEFEPLPFLLDPDLLIKGIVAEKATLFKSQLMPACLTFSTVSGQEYVAIFKHGDDLRQDQLILQMISLMDRLLRRENLDLKLTPYRVLATSSRHGFVQYVDSVSVREVSDTEGSILNFFRKYHPSDSGPYGIAADVMDNYIRSCAGYCVITYLLGVGDRHLDNLMLTKSGKLFHIDFGYILGRDPKPLPPPMKLSKEMVEAMGGVHSEHYTQFRKLCYTTFLHLRRHANLILNLFALMVDASVPDIALEPDKTVRKVQDKFRLDLNDEEALRYMQNLIDVSAAAVMAALVEQLHKIAQYWRK